MKKILLAALIGLLSNFAVLPLYAQPLDTGECAGGAESYVIETLSLEHAKPVTVDYETGQTVTLAGDAEGTGKLVGRSVVAIEFEPSGKGIGYGVEQDSLPVQDVTPLMITGQNTVSLTAVDVRDCAWLIITGQCAGANAQDAVVNEVATPTRVLIPTPTPAAVAESAIVSHSVNISHADAIVNSGKTPASVVDSGKEAAVKALMQRMARVLLAMAMLGLILLFTMSDLYRLRFELLQLVGWCKRQEWGVMLQRVMTLDAAQFAAWRRQQALRLYAKYNAVKARLLNWLKRLG